MNLCIYLFWKINVINQFIRSICHADMKISIKLKIHLHFIFLLKKYMKDYLQNAKINLGIDFPVTYLLTWFLEHVYCVLV